MKFGTALHREVSPPFGEEPCTALEQGLSFLFYFPANKERSQLCNITVNRYRLALRSTLYRPLILS